MPLLGASELMTSIWGGSYVPALIIEPVSTAINIEVINTKIVHPVLLKCPFAFKPFVDFRSKKRSAKVRSEMESAPQ